MFQLLLELAEIVRSDVLNWKALFLLAGLLVVSSQEPAMAQPIVEIESGTQKGFNQYVLSYLSKIETQLASDQEFLFSDREIPVVRERLKAGEVMIKQVEETPVIEGGIIHHWRGAVFFPTVKMKQVVDLLTDYERHQEIYPEVIESRLVEKQGNHIRGFLRLKKKQFFVIVLDTEYETEIIPVTESRQAIHSASTRISEIRDFGKSDQQELPVGKDSGFVWRLNTYWRLEQGDTGVFAECDSISLSRGIPSAIDWMIRPIINGVPRQTLEALLKNTREALAVK